MSLLNNKSVGYYPALFPGSHSFELSRR